MEKFYVRRPKVNKIVRKGPKGDPGATFDPDTPIPYIILDPTAGDPETPLQGMAWWDQQEETWSIKQDGATLQVGQEVQWPVTNTTGSTILDGTPVMAVGTVGATGRLLIAKMDGTDATNAKFLLGIATHDIANNANGKVTEFGKVREQDTSAWNEGDVLWISSTVAGELTSTEPPATSLGMPVAFVVNSNANVGVLAIRITSIDEHLVLTPDVRDALDGAASPSAANVFFTADDMLSIVGQGWTPDDLDPITTTLTMDAALFSEFTATLPLTGTTTTISIDNMPTAQGYIVLNLITGATFDQPVWSGIDATALPELVADTSYKIALYHFVNTSGRKVVAILMHSEADA